MKVVSNTSPLTNLAAIGQLDLLRQLYSTIEIAEAVWQELNAYGTAWPGSREVAAAAWIAVRPVANQAVVTALRSDLDAGEAETIALALENSADLVLLDEREGRKMARRFGLDVIGVLGILLDAKAIQLLPAIRPSVDALRQQAGFYVGDELYTAVLQLADEHGDH